VHLARLSLAAVLAALAASVFATVSTGAVEQRCRPNSVRAVTTATRSVAGVVRAPTAAFRRPGASPLLHLARSDRYGFPTTLLVLAQRVDARCRPTWYRVRLPVYPNNTIGWVRAAALKVSVLHRKIVVDVSSHRLFLYRSGRLEMTVPVAVGKPSTPTPTGHFYVTQRFVLPNSSGPYGPRALGISAFSNVLRSWTDGGPIGLHGTNEPFSVSRPVSHGCVRLSNDAIVRLFRVTALGTPVTVRS
jgi:lipoprotein-anchoring transpeptidase ErfK/SrfK